MINRVPSSLNTSCLCISRYITLLQLSNYRFRISRSTPCVHVRFLGYVFYSYGVQKFTVCMYISRQVFVRLATYRVNPLNPELNPICYLLALLGAHHFLHASRIRVKLLTFRLLMSYIYIYMEHPFLMFLDHTQRRSTVGRTPLDE